MTTYNFLQEEKEHLRTDNNVQLECGELFGFNVGTFTDLPVGVIQNMIRNWLCGQNTWMKSFQYWYKKKDESIFVDPISPISQQEMLLALSIVCLGCWSRMLIWLPWSLEARKRWYHLRRWCVPSPALVGLQKQLFWITISLHWPRWDFL